MRMLLIAACSLLLAADPAANARAQSPEWIWLKAPDGRPSPKVYFRKQIDLEGRPSTARIHVACDNKATVYINGEKVLSHGEWQQPAMKEITAQLLTDDKSKAKRALIAIEAENVGEGAAGLIAQVVVESRKGGPWNFVTDGTWKASATAGAGWQKPGFDDSKWSASQVVGQLGSKPWSQVNAKTLLAAAVVKQPQTTDPARLKVAKGFRVERLYSVPRDTEGSWVNLCVDPKGRLIVSDQYGGLFRVTPPPLNSSEPVKVEKIPADIGEAQGLLWAFDSLYVVVNRGEKYASGLYRVRDSNGDDMLDAVEQLAPINGGGEHGPHAILPAPDGKSLYVVCGNGTKLMPVDNSRVPRLWGEDHLLPRMPDGRGFMRDVLAPGGCIYRIDPDGKHWELVSNGFRNEFDAAINRAGELFSYDADMEWDVNTPWYRPTRVCHVTSGAEFGWRNGAGKWPAYYADSLPATVDIGPGSPTGIAFGYGAKFPVKYQEALFICDWSYGKLYAVHLSPSGSTYAGATEEFVTGSPLPLTDVIVRPQDGALYFTVGGRKTTSGLYRVTYTGSEPTTEAPPAADAGAELRAIRHKLEAFHGRQDAAAIETAWPYLAHEDRFIRFAARVAIEHQAVDSWRDKALTEKNPQAALTALLALARASAADPFHRADTAGTPSPELATAIASALERLDLDQLSADQQVELMRVYAVFLNRFDGATPAIRERLLARYSGKFPTGRRPLDIELCNILVYLQDPALAARAVPLVNSAPTQEEQIDYARALRVLKSGWTPELRKQYFQWFVKAANYRGGASFALFVAGIKNDAVGTLSDPDKLALKELIETKPEAQTGPIAPPRPFVKEWKLDELMPLVERKLKNRDFDHGRAMFAAANCFACHRFDGQGGAVGPDLSAAAGRFSARDLLESVIDPSKTISDQYAAITVVTTDGRVVTGRIVNLHADSMMINTNMLDPQASVSVDQKMVEEILPSTLSMMPQGLLNTLHEEELLDLVAYLLSRGDRTHEMFKPAGASAQAAK